MRRIHLLSLGAIGAAALALAACGSSSSSSSSSGSKTTTAKAATTPSGQMVKTAHTALGTVLVDGKGRALYVFARDTGPTSMCSGQCAVFWPPLIAHAKPAVSGGVNASAISLVKRGNTQQVDINGHPLYYFKNDTKPGEFSGQGVNAFGAKWWAVSPAGAAVMHAPSSSKSSSGSSGSGGYSY